MAKNKTTVYAKRSSYRLRKSIETVKDTVSVASYAATLTELHRVGRTLRGCCPIHGGRNPQSFAVYPEEGRWYCFRCSEGGDVIDLACAVEGGETWEPERGRLLTRVPLLFPAQRPPGPCGTSGSSKGLLRSEA